MEQDVDNLVDFGDEIQEEDIFICEHVQRALQSASYNQAGFPSSGRTACTTFMHC